MKIAVIGAGGVRGYFGGKIAASGYDLTFVARCILPMELAAWAKANK